MNPKVKYQQITITIPSAGAIVPIDAETDKLYKSVTGLNVVMSDEKNKFSLLQLAINTVEVSPENFEVLRVLFRNQVPFGYDYHDLHEPAGGSKIKGRYKDVDSGGTYPYTVVLSFRLENK